MKIAAYILCCLLLSGIRLESASAAVITVNVTGHVTQLSDPSGVLAGQMVMGQAITGTYTYDTSTPDQGSPGFGTYQPGVPPANVTISAGTLSFQTYSASPAPSPAPIQILVSTGTNPYFQVFSNSNQLLNAGVQVGLVNSIIFNFFDPADQWPASDALPSGAPTPPSLAQSVIFIQGGPGANITVMAQIDSVALAPPTFEVSPASGSFLVPQHFDAAVVLPAGTQPVVSVQASVNGYVLPFSYPGLCTLTPLVLSSQQAILCPNSSSVLTAPPGQLGPPGPLSIVWQVSLADGTIMNKTVVWTLLQ